MKEKLVEMLSRLSDGTENALKGIVSKRLYVFAALIYLAVSQMDRVKFLGICAVACVYIWSETQRKKSA